MKLKKLVMTAFGPYAKREEIDFEEKLDGSIIFLITGNTGAGKTTIFDGINFALYGEASGSDRDGKSLRSDYANPETKTEVELHFSIRNKNYVVKRSPQYFRKKKNGDGFTESKPTAELIIEKYLENEGKVITGSKEVTRNIEEIIGINAEQFKQLVMIPQGEFKKLLNSDSDKKEEIFRKIFGTNIFAKAQENIKEEANKLKKNVESIQLERMGLLKNFAFREESLDLINLFGKNINIEEILDLLNKEISKDEDEKEAIIKLLEAKKEEVSKKNQELSNIIDNNKIVKAFEGFKERLLNLDSVKEEYKNKSEVAKKARKSLEIKPLEENYNNEIKIKQRNEEDLKLKISLEKDLENKKKTAQMDLEKAEKREEEKIALLNQLKEIQELKSKITIYEKEKQSSLELNLRKEKTLKEVEIINFEIEKALELKLSLEEEIKIISNKKTERNSLLILENNLKIEIKKIEKLKEEINKYNFQNNRHSKGKEFYEKEDALYVKENSKLEEMEDIYRRNLAGLLASNLKDNEECPVCGSTHHPKKGERTSEVSLIKEDDIKIQREIVKKIQDNRQKYYDELVKIYSSMNSILNDNINHLCKEIFERDIEINNLDSLVEVKLTEKRNEEIILREKLILLDREINKEESISKNKENLEVKVSNFRLRLEELNKENLSLSEKLKVVETNLKNIREQFKGGIITLDELNSKEISINLIVQEISKNTSLARKTFEDISSRVDENRGTIKSLENRRVEIEEKIALYKKNLEEKLLNEALSFEEYKQNMLPTFEVEALEKEVETFKSEYLSVSAGYKHSKKLAEGKSEIKDEEVKEALNNLKEEEASLEKKNLNVNSRILRNKDVIKNCLVLNKKIEKDEESYKSIGKLAKIINGDNKKKMSYERYVLAAYFEDIIYAANLRFTKMTNNRFTLMRKEEVGDKRKGQGLDLVVHDIHTSSTRDVKSLSGGESFKASLSLALGLADIVQARAGGIQLDTMFIDEGFGSLDPGSLESAIDCLVSLQDDGRMVGIISHVEELKTRIESKIIINSSNQGSSITFSK